jgi:hypothetical protein
MSRKVPVQLPHYGVKNNLTRSGKTVRNEKGDIELSAKSIARAKRFMRTGKEQRDA